MPSGRRKILKRVALAIAVLAAMVLEALILTAEHWWRQLTDAKITYNEHASTRSRAYISPEGEVLVSLPEEPGAPLYVIYPATGEIGIPPSPSKFILLPLFAYSRDTCPRTADMRGAKVEVDPQLVVDTSRLEFTSFNGARVHVSW
jgi:hypothetical protein